jgi:AraC-like DNA-binding protein
MTQQHKKIFIKNMVSNCCVAVVKEQLLNLGLTPYEVHLGEVELAEALTEKQQENLQVALLRYDLELVDDKNTMMISHIKQLILKVYYGQEERIKINFSDYLSAKINKSYQYISNLFLKAEGTSIQQFIINKKIERAKALLVSQELTVSEIAFQLDYSSVAHLSNQFKKITGFTPSNFRRSGQAVGATA